MALLVSPCETSGGGREVRNNSGNLLCKGRKAMAWHLIKPKMLFIIINIEAECPGTVVSAIYFKCFGNKSVI